MKPNVGDKDAAVRIVLGSIIGLVGFYLKS